MEIYWQQHLKSVREKTAVVQLQSHVWLFAIPWAIARQAPLSMGSSRPEYWSGLPFSSPRDLSDPGIKPESPASPVLQMDSYPSATREALVIRRVFFFSVYKMLHFDFMQLYEEGSAVCGWGGQ